MEPIAHIESPYGSKFGIPRQSGVVESIDSLIVFEEPYRDFEALRGIEEFEYLWLLWLFSEVSKGDALSYSVEKDGWSPTVRPPRLGGNRRIGVFASRSPNRPNRIGLSSVRLIRVEKLPNQGHCLRVTGADLMHGTPILDIKPYLPYTDAHPDARSGFAPGAPQASLRVVIPPETEKQIPPTLLEPLKEILSLDPRPQYHNDPTRIYGITLWGFEIKFSVSNDVLTVVEWR